MSSRTAIHDPDRRGVLALEPQGADEHGLARALERAGWGRPAAALDDPDSNGLPRRAKAPAMSMHEAEANARAAVSALENIKTICADLAPLDTPLSEAQLRQRARLIHGILRTRQQMQVLRDRAINLNEALFRFRQRRDEINAAGTRETGIVDVGEAVDPTRRVA